MATKKDVILAVGFGAVAGIIGWNLWEEFQNDQSSKALLGAMVDETVMIDFPEMIPFRERFITSAENFTRKNTGFIICPETGKCEIRFDYLVPFTVAMGNEIASVINENPDLGSILDRLQEELERELEQMGIQVEPPPIPKA